MKTIIVAMMAVLKIPATTQPPVSRVLIFSMQLLGPGSLVEQRRPLTQVRTGTSVLLHVELPEMTAQVVVVTVVVVEQIRLEVVDDVVVASAVVAAVLSALFFNSAPSRPRHSCENRSAPT
jgi:hypothetical protein